jgi:hypothetical protein
MRNISSVLNWLAKNIVKIPNKKIKCGDEGTITMNNSFFKEFIFSINYKVENFQDDHFGEPYYEIYLCIIIEIIVKNIKYVYEINRDLGEGYSLSKIKIPLHYISKICKNKYMRLQCTECNDFWIYNLENILCDNCNLVKINKLRINIIKKDKRLYQDINNIIQKFLLDN